MARTQIQLPSDGTGKSTLAFDFTETGAPAPNAGVRHAQGLVVCDANGVAVKVDAGGSLQVAQQHVPTYVAASYRLAGTATTPINMLTIENTVGATKIIKIRRIAIDINVSVATAYLLSSYFRMWHRTGVTPTGGTQPTKTVLDSIDAASQANTIVRFPSSADGTASAIVHALPARSPDRSQSHPNLVSAVAGWDMDVSIHDYDKPAIELRAGETLLVALAGASSAVNMHYTVKVMWEELVL